MKTSFLRSWRKKDRGHHTPSSSQPSSSSLLGPVSVHSTPSTIELPIGSSSQDVWGDGDSARSLIQDSGFQDSPAKPAYDPAPSLDLSSGRPPAPPTSRSLEYIRPQRPPRPPSLYSSCSRPSTGRSSLRVKFTLPDSADDASLTPPERPITPPPVQSPHRPHLSVKVRRVPELDGVWQGFLKDVNSDCDTVETYSRPYAGKDSSPGSGRGNPRGHHRSVSRFRISTGTSSSDVIMTREVMNASLTDLPSPVRIGEDQDGSGSSLSKRFHSSLSSSSLPYQPERPSSRTRVRQAPASESTGDRDSDVSSLSSLFPRPPPLILRKKIPKPLVLQAIPSLAPIPSSPSTPTPSITSTSTPTQLPTPASLTTPVSPSAQQGRKTILKRPSTQFARRFEPPPRSPPSTPLPCTPDGLCTPVSPTGPPSPPPKSAHHSLSQMRHPSARPKLPTSHRSTVSDTRFDSSKRRAVSPFYTESKASPQMSELQQSQGRLPTRSVQSRTVQYGYAV